jgi:hypothetical protein
MQLYRLLYIHFHCQARGRIDEKNKRWEMRMRCAERGEVDRKREFNGRNSTQAPRM